MIASDCAPRARRAMSATLAPAATSGVVFVGVRFQTVTSCPLSIRRVAMAAPMRPVPAIPTFTMLSSCFGRRRLPAAVSGSIRRDIACQSIAAPAGLRDTQRLATHAIGERTAMDQHAISERSEIRDGMRIDWDVPITMDDGLVLRADVFRPVARRPLPGHPDLRPLRQGARLPGRLPERSGSAWSPSTPTSPPARRNKYQSWEVVDPEKWVPRRLRLRARGLARRRPLARLSSTTSRRARRKDFYHCIEWAGVQPWSNGKVGLNGISYYAHEPVAGRVAAAAAPRGDVHLGRRRRLVPRHDPPRRHPLARSGRTGTTCR